eukprot:Gb_36184 [translate_table: standard]
MEGEESRSAKGVGGGVLLTKPAASRPPLALPPRSEASPGPMSLVSSFFSEHDPDSECRSFSQLLAGAMASPRAKDKSAHDSEPANTASSSIAKGSSSSAKFKCMPPTRIPIPRSPYLTLPHGLSPSTLLDSPMLLSNAQVEPSPTTGNFPLVPIKEETLECESGSGVLFKPFAKLGTTNSQSTALASLGAFEISHQQVLAQIQAQAQAQAVQAPSASCPPPDSLSIAASSSITALSASASATSSNAAPHQQKTQNQLEAKQTIGASQQILQSREPNERALPPIPTVTVVEKPSADGYNWRKYGQKQVKGSEYPRSYYKCTHPNCPVKKKVERSHDGQVTEIVYKGEHNHPKPQPTRRMSIVSHHYLSDSGREVAFSASGDAKVKANGSNLGSSGDPSGRNERTADVSDPSTSVKVGDTGNGSLERSSGSSDDQGEDGGKADDGDADEPDSKRSKKDGKVKEVLVVAPLRTIREPRVVVQTRSDVDILDDGYRWRKYGQKVVKGNPHPRNSDDGLGKGLVKTTFFVSCLGLFDSIISGRLNDVMWESRETVFNPCFYVGIYVNWCFSSSWKVDASNQGPTSFGLTFNCNSPIENTAGVVLRRTPLFVVSHSMGTKVPVLLSVLLSLLNWNDCSAYSKPALSWSVNLVVYRFHTRGCPKEHCYAMVLFSHLFQPPIFSGSLTAWLFLFGGWWRLALSKVAPLLLSLYPVQGICCLRQATVVDNYVISQRSVLQQGCYLEASNSSICPDAMDYIIVLVHLLTEVFRIAALTCFSLPSSMAVLQLGSFCLVGRYLACTMFSPTTKAFFSTTNVGPARLSKYDTCVITVEVGFVQSCSSASLFVSRARFGICGLCQATVVDNDGISQRSVLQQGSYYKCTNLGCPVRKHVERASNDAKAVITTYEGKHNHDVPAARNSSHDVAGSVLQVQTENTAVNASVVSNVVKTQQIGTKLSAFSRISENKAEGGVSNNMGSGGVGLNSLTVCNNRQNKGGNTETSSSSLVHLSVPLLTYPMSMERSFGTGDNIAASGAVQVLETVRPKEEH